MAQIITKGTVIKQDIASTLTPIAQILSFSHDGASTETYESRTIDQSGAGIGMKPTGYASGGTFQFDLFYDSELAGHQSLTDDITTPAERDYSVTLVGGTEMTFTAGGIDFGFSGEMSDGIKGSVSLTVDGLITYPT